MSKELMGFSHTRAVGDAIMEAQCYFTALGLTRNWVNQIPMTNDSVDIALEGASDSACKTGSIIALHYLRKKFPDNFDFTAILEGNNTNKRPFGTSLGGFSFHIRFLAHGTDNRWYSGSPANYNRIVNSESMLTSLNISTDIKKLMRFINWSEKGEWPSVNLIESTYLNGDVPFEEKDRKFKVIELSSYGKSVHYNDILSGTPTYDESTFAFGLDRTT